ncbi:thymidylate synthase, flavin-dependent [Desulfuribacillus stibiiarsenatis]|uniref:FAD-dependent thymidylate synthase n=1 Tax=Desulfuribacillus stibiiarsenatis TaxID=1390249 RepID=A0A1E5L8J0_9FIRM|nr:FAD-dependent thymidylate synthase [Desulfuribacillus stibiiarsenatis]OEH86309.1 thymidylate synthase, flavin-dependent [Desulfuribacillus stibiiarsenatis]
MKIQLINKTPDFLRTIWTAARTCYSAQTPLQLWNSEVSREEMLRLASRIIDSQHHSVVEHCSVTYAIEEISRTLLAQYSRHRIGISLSVQSQRYVTELSEKNDGLFDIVMPPKVTNNEEATKEYLRICQEIQDSYDRLISLGIPKEDARFVLPGGAGTNMVTTLNLRALFDLYRKRCITKGAQWEIKDMVQVMVDQLLEQEPWLEQFFAKEGSNE